MVRSLALIALAVAASPVVLASEVASPPRSTVPSTPPAYVSALADYKPWREPVLAPWKRVNDEVARLGGHMGHVRGSPAPAPPEVPKAAGDKR